MRPSSRTQSPAAPRFKAGMTATGDYPDRLAPFDRKSLARWAADCAEHVLPHFEALHPSDDRPRLASEAARAWSQGLISMTMARSAAVNAHAAARDAKHPAAVAAARSAGHAAATAHMIAHARGAAAYAIVAAAAAAATAGQQTAIAAERSWQLARIAAL